jgi:chemotaxis protein methyltransferase CheR
MERPGELEMIEERLFLEAVHARYGYDLRGYAPLSMGRRIRGVLAATGLPHLGELQHRILTDPALFGEVLGGLTVNVSDMFRDPNFYRTLRQRVVPRLRTYPLLRIWLAGCATGEEVYAMSILLAEEGLYDRTQIYATDLSPAALAAAQQGIYPADRLSAFAENHKESGGTSDFASYCTVAYDQIAMKEGLRRNVLFFGHNLVSDHVFAEMQLVFCRNVLIYFGGDLKASVLDKLHESLCPGGYLCLGGSEHLPGAMQTRFLSLDGGSIHRRRS